METKILSMDGEYFVVLERVKVLFIVPILMVLGIFELPLGNYLLMIFCFIGGFMCKFYRSKEDEKNGR